MDTLLLVAVCWAVVSLVVIWRLVTLLRRALAALEQVQRESRLDLERHNQSLAQLLATIRAFMEESAQTLDSKAAALRQLVADAEDALQRAAVLRTLRMPEPTSSSPAMRPADPPRGPEAVEAAQRRRQVAERLAQGDAPEQIAREMGISQREVDLIARLERRSG